MALDEYKVHFKAISYGCFSVEAIDSIQAEEIVRAMSFEDLEEQSQIDRLDNVWVDDDLDDQN
jgi:hypothetical protein